MLTNILLHSAKNKPSSFILGGMIMYIRKCCFLIFCMTLLFGCQNQNADEAKLEEDNQTNNRFLQVENTKTNETEQLSNTEIANHLAKVASSVPEVNQASALVAGPYTVVAIDVNEDIDRSRVGSIKYSVSEALYHDPWGKTAVVVADADLMARLRGMGDQVQEGYPVRGIVDELSAIVSRYMPEFPVNDDQPQENDDNKEILPDEEQNQLDDIQEEQSNHRKE